MRALIIGNGGREHAITWKFSNSKRISGLCTIPGNAGCEETAECFPDIQTTDIDRITGLCRDKKINLVFVGPEAALAEGIVDHLSNMGIPVIGPHKEAAQLESSKTFAKEFLKRNKIPTADSREFKDVVSFEKYIRNSNGKLVVKKSGLAAGKGVLESEDTESLLKFGREILKNDSLLVEEYLSGYEISVFALLDGSSYLILPPCADYKKAGEGGKGPNTGGMGSICPVPWLSNEIKKQMQDTVFDPTFNALQSENLMYRGILYFGIMVTEDGPYVLEFNVRLGDPETQVLLPLINSDFGNLSEAIVKGKLADFPLKIADTAALGVVIAAPGYPGIYPKDAVVKEIPDFPSNEVLVFHSSTYRDSSGMIRTGGGRCFTVVGRGKDLLGARARAYSAVKQIYFDGAWYRSDIGGKIFG